MYEVVKRFDIEGFKPLKVVKNQWKDKRVYYNLVIGDNEQTRTIGYRTIGYIDVATGRKVDDKKIAHIPPQVKEWWATV